MDEITLKNIMDKLEELQSEITSIKGLLPTEKMKVLGTHESPEVIREESFMEFFRKYNPKKDTDKTLVIMKTLESIRGLDNITSKNITESFREVREKIPKNVADKIQLLHKKGFVMPGEIVDKMKGWIITRSGLDYLGKMKNEKSNEK